MAVFFFKEMKILDKEVRVWDVYTGLESMVKNLLTSLRAVNELQNSAVRERHWQQLMNTTGVRGTYPKEPGTFLCSICDTVSTVLLILSLLLCDLMFLHLTVLPSHVQPL